MKNYPLLAILVFVSMSLFPATLPEMPPPHSGQGEETPATTDSIMGLDLDTVYQELPSIPFPEGNVYELPEFVVESKSHRVLHLLAYIREHSTLSTFTDTITLFREKLVDYMLPADRRVRFKGWSTPRMLTSKSYYRFTNDRGLDSVSDASSHHFSWSDWIGIPPGKSVPEALADRKHSIDTVKGKFGATEIWTRNNDAVGVEVNVLSDTLCRSWIPALSSFFRNGFGFDRLRLCFRYNNVTGDTVRPADFIGCTYDIESVGRGHHLFRFNKPGEPFFVTTSADVYLLDKEYITVKEAKKWENHLFDADEIDMFQPAEAPALQPEVQALIARVNGIDRNKVRLDADPDRRLVSIHSGRGNFNIGTRALALLKQATGITLIKSHKNFNKHWSGFREGRKKRNTDTDQSPQSNQSD